MGPFLQGAAQISLSSYGYDCKNTSGKSKKGNVWVDVHAYFIYKEKSHCLPVFLVDRCVT